MEERRMENGKGKNTANNINLMLSFFRFPFLPIPFFLVPFIL